MISETVFLFISEINPFSLPSSSTSRLLKVLLCITYTPTFDLNGSAVLKIAEVSAPLLPAPTGCSARLVHAHSCLTSQPA